MTLHRPMLAQGCRTGREIATHADGGGAASISTNRGCTGRVGHTSSDGFTRLARQAAFGGDVVAGARYLLVDDFIGQGGTLANLRGYIEHADGRVVGATVLTGKPFSAKLKPETDQLSALRNKHGRDLEAWWIARFGHAFDCLTQSEARYLERTRDADTVRNRVTAAE